MEAIAVILLIVFFGGPLYLITIATAFEVVLPKSFDDIHHRHHGVFRYFSPPELISYVIEHGSRQEFLTLLTAIAKAACWPITLLVIFPASAVAQALKPGYKLISMFIRRAYKELGPAKTQYRLTESTATLLNDIKIETEQDRRDKLKAELEVSSL